MTYLEAQDQFGSVVGYVDHLRELKALDDLRFDDITETLRDINYIRLEGGEKAWSHEQLITMLV